MRSEVREAVPQSAIRNPPSVIRVVLGALGFRLVSALLALFVNLTFPLHQREQFTVFGSTSPFWDTFARYDSGYFEGIAWGGYAPLAGGRSNIAYFPVYPLLMRAVARLFGRQHAIFYISGHRDLVAVLRPRDGRALLPGAARSAAAPRGARGAADDDFSVLVLLRRRVQREHVSAVRGARLLWLPHAALGGSAACAARSRRRRACPAS